MAVIPKSVKRERILEWTAEEMEGWELTEDDMTLIDAMDDGHKYCWNPVDVE